MVPFGERPKLKLPKTTGEWVWDGIGLACYLGAILLLIAVWGDLPDKVPAHYNAQGEVDRWGSKGELWILPAIGLFVWLTMLPIEKRPEIHNYPKRLNEANAAQFYLTSRKMINRTKNMTLIIFSLIVFETTSIAMDWGVVFGKWMLPLLIGCMAVPLVWGVVQFYRIK